MQLSRPRSVLFALLAAVLPSAAVAVPIVSIKLEQLSEPGAGVVYETGDIGAALLGGPLTLDAYGQYYFFNANVAYSGSDTTGTVTLSDGRILCLRECPDLLWQLVISLELPVGDPMGRRFSLRY